MLAPTKHSDISDGFTNTQIQIGFKIDFRAQLGRICGNALSAINSTLYQKGATKFDAPLSYSNLKE